MRLDKQVKIYYMDNIHFQNIIIIQTVLMYKCTHTHVMLTYFCI